MTRSGRERAFLERLDHEGGKLDHPLYSGIRRKKLRDLVQQLNGSRAQRVAERRATLERDADDYRRLLETELQRYEDTKPKPEPEPKPKLEDDFELPDDDNN